MKHSKLILLFLLAEFFLSAQTVGAQQSTYNYTQAVKALQDGNIADGRSYLFKELAANPKNGYAWLLMSASYAMEENVDSALISIDNAIRFVPKTDGQMLVKCYNAKVKYLSALGEKAQELATLNEALKRLPNHPDLYALRADFYSDNEQYELARKDYKKLLSIDKGNVDAMAQMGHLYLLEEKYADGLGWYNKALSADDSNEEARVGRALIYLAMEKTEPAVDDLLVLQKNGSDKPGQVLLSLTDSAATRDVVFDKIKARQAAEPNVGIWPYALGGLYSHLKQHDTALTYYRQAFDIYKDAESAKSVGLEYFAVNRYKEAQEWADKALQLANDSNETADGYYEFAGDILKDQGKYDAAIKRYTEAVQANKERANSYFQRAMCCIYQGKNKEALPDLDVAAENGENGVAAVYVWRGWIYKQLGKTMEAQGDFRNAVEKDSVGTPLMATFISQHFLGIDKAAKASAARCLKESGDADDYVSVACLYALLGDKPMAVRNLELAIEKGYNSWYVLRDHPWLKPLKGYADYEALLKKHLK